MRAASAAARPLLLRASEFVVALGPAAHGKLNLFYERPERDEAVLLPLPLPLAADLQSRVCGAEGVCAMRDD
jgi:hypothetical protein